MRIAVFRLFAAAAAAMLAGGALAATSHCAQLPARAQAEVQGPDEYAAAQLTAQGAVCPAGFALEELAGANRCRRAGGHEIAPRNPRRDCYASLELGPVRGVPMQKRPSQQCAGATRIDSIIALRGRNIGWDDVALTAGKGVAVQITPLQRSGEGVAPAEDPYRRDCSPHDCRLLRLTTRKDTPARIDLTLATPDNASTTRVPIMTEAICPGR